MNSHDKAINRSDVLLIQPYGGMEDVNRTFIGAQFEEPVSLEYLEASLEQKGFTSVVLASSLSLDEFLAEVEKHRPLVLGFCCHTTAIEKSLFFSKKAKEKAVELGFELFTLFGGYHCSALPDQVLSEENVDFVIPGEGELVICDLVDALIEKKDLSKVQGIYYKEQGLIKRNPRRKRIEDLDSIPWPKRYKEFTCQPKEQISNLAYPPPSVGGSFGRVIYSRGCPFACSFCSSKNTWGSQVFWRSPKDVADELEMLVEKFNINYAFFLDLTFNANRQKVLELCDELVRRDLPVHCGAMNRLDLFDKEILDAMVRAKFAKTSLGIESPLMATTSKVKDEYKIKTQQALDTLAMVSDCGMIVRGFLIIGFPDQTKEEIESYIPELNNYHVDELRITIATPFPNTSLWEECRRKKLLPKKINWSDYSTEKLVFKHPHLSNDEVLLLRKKIAASFYFHEAYIKRIEKKIQKYPHLKISWMEYFQRVQRRNTFPNHNVELQDLLNKLKAIKVS